MGKSKNFTKQQMQKCENIKYPVQVAVNGKNMAREINHVKIAYLAAESLTRNNKIQQMEQ